MKSQKKPGKKLAFKRSSDVRKSTQIKVELIGNLDPYLTRVKELHRANAGNLGMFPAGAFDEYATLRQILGAVNRDGLCVGYVLFRIAKERAMIAHLCIDDNWRNKGISRALVERLAAITKAQGLRGIGLRCRRDYDASRAWPRLGFVPLYDKPGRSLDGTELTFWWLDHKQPDLFLMAAAIEPPDERLIVVIDANVFFDLYDDSDPESSESKALRADWLQDSVEFCLTTEILTEINRNEDKNARERQRTRARTNHRMLEPAQTAVSAAVASVRHLFPTELAEADESDLRQLSKAIAEGVQFFITRDERLLRIADQVYDVAGISILRPTALINRLDSLHRESEYQPIRLGGSRCKLRRVTCDDEDLLLQVFQAGGAGENVPSFLKRLRRLLSAPPTTECFVAENERHEPLAVYGHIKEGAHEMELPLLRAARGSLAPTVARHLLARAVQAAVDEDRMVTVVTDAHVDSVVLTALEESSFSFMDGTWLKLNLGVADSAHHLSRKLDELAAGSRPANKLALRFAKAMQMWQASPDVTTAIALERALWPAKILNADVPCFIVPIQPGWAQSLFDEGLANQELFGEVPELVLKREQVYYRANQPCGLVAPGRILWYVSSDTNRQGTMSIRACSRLDEIVVGKPRELFRQFRRLGVYKWRDVFNKANHDLDRHLMALRFSDTELFKTPVSRQSFRKLGVISNLQSPLSISKEQFAEIYRSGIGRP